MISSARSPPQQVGFTQPSDALTSFLCVLVAKNSQNELRSVEQKQAYTNALNRPSAIVSATASISGANERS